VPIEICAQVLGISASTVRRRLKPTARTPRPCRDIEGSVRERVSAIIRATHGLVGAASLSKQCNVSRRMCAEIKQAETRAMELERKAACESVRIASPGIMRGFDAMHVRCSDTMAYWLVAADAAVPYRTSISTVDSYDACNVVTALRNDFDAHGPPLVVRLDRIACQRTPDVEELFNQYQVLGLHGPPRHPYYYGQLERQNREHRGWLSALGPVTRQALVSAAERMRTALNASWARPTLDWCTAEQVWQRRVTPTVDRTLLRTDVDRCTARLIATGYEPLRARRLAIESALEERGLLTINQGGWR